MTAKILHPVAGSFRDPSGQVYTDESGQIYRSICHNAKENFDTVAASGAFEALHAAKLLIGHTRCEDDALPLAEDVALRLHHPKLPFVSYPYEWGFSQLQAAALCHLDTHLMALEYDVTLSDASAYNIQFIGTRPVFIDTLSLIPYCAGMRWQGQRQFVEEFLTPLLLWAYGGVPYHAWYRGGLRGIPAAELNRLLPWWRKCSLGYISHVYLLQLFEGRSAGQQATRGKERPLPKEGLVFMLRQLRRWIARLSIPAQQGHWQDYTALRSYSAEELEVKTAFVSAAVQTARPQQLWDIGCNTGEFSAMALEAGAQHVIGFEYDKATQELAWSRAQEQELAFLPLTMDICNPSPDAGWQQYEREGLHKRAKADFVLALAVLHHMVIGNNVPVTQAVDFLLSLAPEGVLEWVPKTDVMIQHMLSTRDDVFHDYTWEHFSACLHAKATVIAQQEVVAHGRVLIHYRCR